MIEEVDVSLQALSKTGRYYGRAELERKLDERINILPNYHFHGGNL
jgi:hypothetical protein